MSKLTLLFLFIVVNITGCDHDHQRSDDKYLPVLEHFRDDSLKLKAARFIIDNLSTHYAVITSYEDKNGKDLLKAMALYNGDDPVRFKDSLGASIKVDTIYDVVSVSPQYLIKDIEHAFRNYQENMLNRQIPFTEFCEYILPYRVGTEAVNEWREYNNKRYQKLLLSLGKREISDSFFIKYLSTEQDMWYYYDYSGIKAYYKPSENQTIKEILVLKTPYSCEDFAIHTLYQYRSLGIPAAYEIIPFFGKFNSGHAEASILYKSGKFINPRDTLKYQYQIAKMYRRTFSKQPNPFTAIKNLEEDVKDIPPYFNMDHYIDITNERTTVSNIVAKSEMPGTKKVAYLCVYNGGVWQPVEWGKYDTSTHSCYFTNMGRKILYQLAHVYNGKVFPNNHPFIVDSLGNVCYLNGSTRSNNEVLVKYDRHNDVIPGKEYILYAWSNANKNWMEAGRKLSRSNGISFKLPPNTLYKLEEVGYEGEAIRPFTVTNGKQVWW